MKMLVKILNFIKVVLSLALVLSFVFLIGVVGGVENGQSISQGILYAFLGLTVIVLSYLGIVVIERIVKEIIANNSELQLKYYVG